MVAAADGIQDPYMSILDLTTSEHINIYNKSIVGLSESSLYDLTGPSILIFTNKFRFMCQ